ncbi:hypothetical protein OGATHE_004522 [Ogataea polymorpha]|uniref:Uncharacterized protein n=1 Tax=Ogataea polymorpha TaxID=460523 RepID=A0A9P8T2N2_9ASCO|nr:hypothetical protein OGATHE_004522 [Ogataea polymorpha]
MDRPDGQPNAFCEPVKTKSIPQASNSNSSHAVAQTASTTIRVFGDTFLTRAAISLTFERTPEEVSVWVIVIMPASAKCSEKKPVDTTSTASEHETRLAPTSSQPRVPDPDRIKGWVSGSVDLNTFLVFLSASWNT